MKVVAEFMQILQLQNHISKVRTNPSARPNPQQFRRVQRPGVRDQIESEALWVSAKSNGVYPTGFQNAGHQKMTLIRRTPAPSPLRGHQNPV